MAFTENNLVTPEKIKSGEAYDINKNTILTASVFENSLKVGRFAKLDTGSIDNIDASATPVVAGVVLREFGNPLEDTNALDSDFVKLAHYTRSGMVTVDVVATDSPAVFGAVFVHNLADANAGKATTIDDANTEPSNAEFIQEIEAGTWLIRLI